MFRAGLLLIIRTWYSV